MPLSKLTVNFSVEQKLHIVERVKSGECSHRRIRKEYGIPETTLRQWLDSESRFREELAEISKSSIAAAASSKANEETADSTAQIVSKKLLRPGREVDIERLLFRWYIRQHEEFGAASLSDTELQAKARSLARRLNRPDLKVTDDWLRRWKEAYGVRTISLSPSSPAPATPASSVQVNGEQSPSAQLGRIIQDGGYSEEQVYFCTKTSLAWKHLPDKTLYTNFFGGANDGVTLLVAANKTGSHRLKLVCVGREWRPRCFRHVNMINQPLLYMCGNGTEPYSELPPEMFLWWFYQEFATSVSFHLRANKIDEKALLVVEHADYLPQEEDCVTVDGKIRLVVLPRDDFTETGNCCLDHDAVTNELKIRYKAELLSGMALVKDETSVVNFIKKFTLKDMFVMMNRAWMSLRSEVFQRCWTTIDNSLSGGEGEKWCSAEEFHQQQLYELQWLAHDLGLEVTDDDLKGWVEREEPLDLTDLSVKIESDVEADDSSGDEEPKIPSAGDAVSHLEQVLLWMETEPFEPATLLLVREVLARAKQASKMGLAPTHPGASLPFFCHNGDHLTQPPPAHMGIPPYQLDPKTGAMGEYWRGLGLGLSGQGLRPGTGQVRSPGPAPPGPGPGSPSGVGLSAGDWKRLGPLLAAGLTRPPMYPFTTSQYPYPMLSPDMSQVAATWHTPSMYPISTAGAGFRSPYPSSLPITSTSLSRFSPTGLIQPHPGLSPHHPSLSHSALMAQGPKQELSQAVEQNHRPPGLDQKIPTTSTTEGNKTQDSGQTSNNQDKKKPHIKKPLNAFMLYMKEMRAKVVAECTLKESAAINQILGRRWHALGREEQAKYYELARRERQLHMQLYPDWSSRSNSSRGKKRKRKQDTNDGGSNLKKCRARYGLDQQSQWCKPCRRKKKCIRYLDGGDGNQSEDNMGSSGSVGDAMTPESKIGDSDHDQHNNSSELALSSPGLSLTSPGMSLASPSLTSPSMILPSPSTSLASPSVSLASPCMSLQSPLTPHESEKTNMNNHVTPSSSSSSSSIVVPNVPPHRNPVGTNPHDINNPLSVNQLTGQCNPSTSKTENKDSNARAVISVT